MGLLFQLVIWSRIWCFTAEVKQMSMITKELYVLCLWGSFRGYESWMNRPDTDSALSLDDYFFNVCEQWVFVSISPSVKLWLKLASRTRSKKQRGDWETRPHGIIAPTSFTLKIRLRRDTWVTLDLKTHYYSEKWNYQNANIPCIRSDL